MFNKKRIFIFVVFIIFLFFMMTFASAPEETVRVITREVKFTDGFDNKELARYNVEVGTSVNPPSVPTHYNKAFAGWYDYYDNRIKIEDFSSILNDTNAVALYGDDLNGNGILDENEEHYLVTFVNGVTNDTLKEENVLVGMDATAPESPYVSGYTFAGWNNSYTNVQSNLTVTSVHNRIVTRTNTTPTRTNTNNNTNNNDNTNETPINDESSNKKTYIVTFIDGFNNKVISKEEVQEGLSAGTPSIPTHDKKVFKEWLGNYVNVTKNETVTAIYVDDLNNDNIDDNEEGQKLTVIFLNEGKEVKKEIVLKGNDATAPIGIFKKEETDKYTYTFIGWDKEFTNVQTNLTINAKYGETIKKYIVKIIDGEKETTDEVNYGEEIELEQLVKSYKLTYNEATDSRTLTYSANFMGYCKNSSKCDKKLIGKQTITDNTSFYAVWDDEPLNVVVESGSDYQTGTTNYTFTDWKDELKKVINAQDRLLLTSDKVLTASYTESVRKYTLTVKYVYEDGSKAAETKSMSIANGQVYTVNSPEANKVGYTADKPIVTGTMPTNDKTETVTYIANELEFSCEDIEKDYSLEDQTSSFNSASNGSGNYTYSLEEDNFEVNDEKVLTIKGGTAAGEYEITITAKDTETKKTKDATCKVTINKTSKDIEEGSCNDGLIYNGKPQSLADNGKYVTYENNIETNAGNYTVLVKANKNYIYSDGKTQHELKCSIKKAELSCPTISSYTGDYDEKSHSIEVGTVENGVVQYRMNLDEEWSNTNPLRVNAGNYNVYVQVLGDENYNTVDCGNRIIKINKVDAVCPTLTAYNGNYDKKAHSIGVENGSGGTIQYRMSLDEEWSNTNPAKTDAGSYDIYVQVLGDDNHKTVDCGKETISIAKVNAECPYLADYSGNYDALSHSIVVGTTNDGTIQFKKSGDSQWTTTVPTRTDVGTTMVYTQVIGDKNHLNYRCKNKSINISPRTITVQTNNQEKIYDGSALEADSKCKIINGSLLNDHSMTCIITGSQTVVGRSSKTIENVIIVDGNNNDVSDNYLVTPVHAELVVTKADAVCPQEITSYNGSYDEKEHSIIISSATGGSLEYSTDNVNWSSDMPTRKDVGITKVYIRIKGDSNHKDKNCTSASSYATITINPVVNYDSNGGTGNMSIQEITYNTPTKLNKNIFKKSSNIFVGWNTASDGSGNSYTDEEEVNLTDNLTLYAMWEFSNLTYNFTREVYRKNVDNEYELLEDYNDDLLYGDKIIYKLIVTNSGNVEKEITITDNGLKISKNNIQAVDSSASKVNKITSGEGVKLVIPAKNGDVDGKNTFELEFIVVGKANSKLITDPSSDGERVDEERTTMIETNVELYEITNTGSNIVLTLDYSASMSAPKLNPMRDAAIEFINSVSNENTKICIVVFPKVSSAHNEAEEIICSSNKTDLINVFNRKEMKTSSKASGTPYNSAMKLSGKLINEKFTGDDKNKPYHLVFLSDGISTDTFDGYNVLARDFKDAGVTIHTINYATNSEMAEAEPHLKQMSSNEKYYKNGGDTNISTIFGNIAEDIGKYKKQTKLGKVNISNTIIPNKEITFVIKNDTSKNFVLNDLETAVNSGYIIETDAEYKYKVNAAHDYFKAGDLIEVTYYAATPSESHGITRNVREDYAPSSAAIIECPNGSITVSKDFNLTVKFSPEDSGYDSNMIEWKASDASLFNSVNNGNIELKYMNGQLRQGNSTITVTLYEGTKNNKVEKVKATCNIEVKK